MNVIFSVDCKIDNSEEFITKLCEIRKYRYNTENTDVVNNVFLYTVSDNSKIFSYYNKNYPQIKFNLNEGLKLIKKDFNKKDKLILIGHFNEPINLSGFKDVEICFVGNEPIIKKINKTSKLKLAKYILNN